MKQKWNAFNGNEIPTQRRQGLPLTGDMLDHNCLKPTNQEWTAAKRGTYAYDILIPLDGTA